MARLPLAALVAGETSVPSAAAWGGQHEAGVKMLVSGGFFRPQRVDSCSCGFCLLRGWGKWHLGMQSCSGPGRTGTNVNNLTTVCSVCVCVY